MKKLQTLFIGLLAWGSGAAQDAALIVCRDSNVVYHYYSDLSIDKSSVTGLRDGGNLTWGGPLDGSSQYYNISLFRTAADGAIDWSNQLIPGSDTVFNETIGVVESANGDLLISGLGNDIASVYPQFWFLACLSPAGQLNWYRAYQLDPPDGTYQYPLKIAVTTDEQDNVYASVQYSPDVPLLAYQSFSIISTFSSAGSLLWEKSFIIQKQSNDGKSVCFRGIFAHDGFIDLLSYTGSLTPFTNMRLKAVDGAVLFTKVYRPTGYEITPNAEEGVYRTADGKYIMYGNITNGQSSDRDFSFNTVVFDPVMDPVKSYQVKTYFQSGHDKNMIVTASGQILYGISRDIAGGLYYARVDTDFTIRTQKKISYTNPALGNFYLAPLCYSRDGKIFLRSSGVDPLTSQPRLDYFSADLDVTQTNDCFTATDTAFMQMVGFNMEPVAFQWDQVGSGLSREIKPLLREQPAVFTMERGCKEVNSCHSPVISGPDSICLAAAEVQFTAQKGGACHKLVNWTIDTAAIVSQRVVNDSTVAIRFKDTWTGKLYATIPGGCNLGDSLSIIVFRERPGELLGQDTSICTGDHLLLDAGEGFASYDWSTGEGSRSIEVSRQGEYRIKAFGTDGCFIQDTIYIDAVYPLPVVELTHSNVLCIGNNELLDAGPDMVTYQWQDGSADRTFRVSSPGEYWVTVSNGYGCYASDTVVFSRQAMAPHAFMGPDTVVCEGAPVVLHVPGYQSYLWNDGSRGPSLTIKQPGIYQVTVTDEDGCQGADTIEVLDGNCPRFFNVPTAFSPNGDGKNDIFQPKISFLATSYHFSIYNRWGGRVFYTSQQAEGWNGLINGKPAVAGTYIWQCTYSIANGAPVRKKGSVLLIR